jgi:hypothetical protein
MFGSLYRSSLIFSCLLLKSDLFHLKDESQMGLYNLMGNLYEISIHPHIRGKYGECYGLNIKCPSRVKCQRIGDQPVTLLRGGGTSSERKLGNWVCPQRGYWDSAFSLFVFWLP